ncbi:Nuclear pore complex protein NUP214 [Vitis vinifera]|uniref:Nuclear pore complex protein NUP214 n=1 Tax=Vitis vinifera TaxID=29760 RepID=A0A438EM42_VITVI|nr:Nuclear pore complex protein NUP214 [Vitis vinifera]
MATPESVIDLEGKDLEGGRLDCDDYVFVKIGESVTIKPQYYNFNLDSPLPSQPLAVSERSQLIFVAHSDGFCVARTEAVIELAKEIKEKGSGSSIQELSVVDVPIANVRILALSTDSSTLAASVGGDIHFFSVDSLLNKGQEPSFTRSLSGSSSVKDMRWRKKMDNSYVVLSSDGKLYHGAAEGPLKIDYLVFLFPFLFTLATSKKAWVIDSWSHSYGRGVWIPSFSRHLNNWEIEIMERFLARLLVKVVVEGEEDKVCWLETERNFLWCAFCLEGDLGKSFDSYSVTSERLVFGR